MKYHTQINKIYDDLGVERLSFDAFAKAYIGYQQIILEGAISKDHLLTIIDFSQSSKLNRFFIADIDNQQLIYQSLVAHGKNSGGDIPESFSNLVNSNKSSLGFYLTGQTYVGKHGLSLRLDGLEKGINDNAKKRHIVIHSADYVSKSFVNRVCRLGRSFGCPSLPADNYGVIIDLIKDKSLIFIYSDQPEYYLKSEYL